uniref:Uncharacterized protein n=1 Tax=Panagrolaimus superbus TaxID=310955 RepID=A0A914Y2E0_9BILA
MGDNPVNLENPGRRCFKLENASFQAYDKDTSKNVMKLEASGSIGCQIFMELPQYMQIEDFPLPNAPYLVLNSTFDGNNASFWWKKDNDKMIPSAVSFDGSGNVEINIFNSTKDIPFSQSS